MLPKTHNPQTGPLPRVRKRVVQAIWIERPWIASSYPSRIHLEAREHANDRLRGVLDVRGVVEWLEPVFGRVAKDQDGQVGTQWRYDSSILRLLASKLPEFQSEKDGAGTNINIHTSASASATSVVSAPAKLKKLQERKRNQLQKAATRRAIPKPE